MTLWGKPIKPMLAETGEPFDDEDWIFEIKFDGTRAIAFVDRNSVKLQNRRLLDITHRYPELTLNKDVKGRVILDGEIVVLHNGKPDFERLQEREHAEGEAKIHLLSKEYPAVYIVFDVLEIDGKDVTNETLMERKRLLERTVKESERLLISEYVEARGKKFFREVQKLGLEGVMAKRKDSKYEIGKRSKNWLKIKNLKTIDCVVCGLTKGKGSRSEYFGSLVLGCYRKGKLVYVGRVGTGFDRRKMEMFMRVFERLRTRECPFPSKPSFESGIELAYWVRPEIVVEVEFLELTKDMKLRAPSLRRIRNDKEPGECVI